MVADPVRLLMSLFATVPHVLVCVKDRYGRYVAVNDAFASRFTTSPAARCVGRCASDLFEPDLARGYDAQDRSLLHTGRPIRNQLEINTDTAGARAWYLTSKVLDDSERANPLIIAVTVQAGLPRSAQATEGVAAAVDLVRAEFASKLRVTDLARAARMSTDQLERATRRLLAVSPKELIMRTRIEEAGRMLATSPMSVAQVALQCGYYDQSQFSRQFKAWVGQSPSAYRANTWSQSVG